MSEIMRTRRTENRNITFKVVQTGRIDFEEVDELVYFGSKID